MLFICPKDNFFCLYIRPEGVLIAIKKKTKKKSKVLLKIYVFFILKHWNIFRKTRNCIIFVTVNKMGDQWLNGHLVTFIERFVLRIVK
jgi:hypothetical protein